MLITNLKPVFSSNKDYYGKALVITLDNGVKILKSYDTVVCVIVPNIHKTWATTVVLPWMDWSATTGKHTWDFLCQNDIKIDVKKLGFKSFANLMREVSSFIYKNGKVTQLDGSTWVRNYQNLELAIKNWETL